MAHEEGNSVISSTCVFRGMEYIVSMHVSDASTLTVEVEDRLSADQWRGTFDASYIEDLTHKTGNFKQYSIFVSMLETAVTKTSDAVSLDLLTYADLELLRNRKAGVGTRAIPGAKSTALNTKRYLILTYTVEFDRIHYPLPLPYMGKPDPVLLQETVRTLREEIKRIRKQKHPDYREGEFTRIKKEYEKVLKEKEEIEAAYMQFRREVKNTSKGSAAKEVRILKNIVKNLEDEVTTEKAKFRRQANKRNQDYRSLLEEVEELRASERNLRARVKSLTNELAVFKRGRISRASPIPNVSSSAQRRERERIRRPRSLPRERSLSRDRSLSRERPSSVSSARSITPSGCRLPRFDPTAYISDKKRKQDDAKSKRDRSIRRYGNLDRSRNPSSAERGRERTRPSPLYSGGYRRARTSSMGSMGSRTSSLSDIDMPSTSSQRLRGINNVLKGRTSSSAPWASPDVPLHMAGSGKSSKKTKSRTRRAVSTPDPAADLDKVRRLTNTSGKIRKRDVIDYEPIGNRNGYYHDRSAEMSEIDARLNALQQFMQNNLN
uniref:Centrosomal protein CCDC61 n=1 Tax=Saccoglossus kowalevskii TaxID=10224 RepID=A0ABM0MDQ4_SACKO|nr:PREDICTED: coiled-coil domain-containing protein 61-like [Saccoglossus kowalevskii]